MSTKNKEAISNPPKETEKPNFFKYQCSVFLITYLAYVVFYLCRKPLSVVKTRLEGEGVSLMALGMMDTLHLAMYTIGQFVNGALVDKKGPRWILGIGLWLTGISVALVGVIGYLPWNPLALSVIICLLWGANGFGQSTGWPGCVSALSPWFKNNRGALMGVWTTSYTIGGIGGTLLTTILVEHYDWKIAFIVPAVIAILTGCFTSTLLINHPSEVYNQEPTPTPTPGLGEKKKSSDFSLIIEVFKLKGLMYVSWSYFCIKLIRYALLFWLPYYLGNVLHYPETTAGYMSTWFEVGGIFGGIILGWVSDKFKGPRVMVAAPCILLVAVGLGLFQIFSGEGLFASGICMSFIGFFTVAPEILLSGVVVQEIGGQELVGKASGVVNGMGSLGSTLQGVLVASIASLGWHYVFYLLIALSVMGFVCLIPPCLWAIEGQDDKKRK